MFCKTCGAKFINETDKCCAYCGTERGQGTNYCSGCGAIVNPGQIHCTNCGVKINPNAPDWTPSMQQQQAEAGFTSDANMNNADYAPFPDNNLNESVFSYSSCFNEQQPRNTGLNTINNSDIELSSRKSRMAAGLLALFLGGLGIHNFYLGYKTKAITQLVLFIVGVCTACLVVGFFIIFGTLVWSFVEAILIFAGGIDKDADGNKLIN